MGWAGTKAGSAGNEGQVPTRGLLRGLGSLAAWPVDLSGLSSEAFLHHLPTSELRLGSSAQLSQIQREMGKQLCVGEGRLWTAQPNSIKPGVPNLPLMSGPPPSLDSIPSAMIKFLL